MVRVVGIKMDSIVPDAPVALIPSLVPDAMRKEGRKRLMMAVVAYLLPVIQIPL